MTRLALSERALVVADWAVHVPSPRTQRLADLRGVGPACEPGRASEWLGRKSLLYMEDATRLSLCAVHRALGLAPGVSDKGEPDPRRAVVASSNLGSLQTARLVARSVRAGSCKDVSPLQAPNVASNVIASSVALRYRCGGPNLMLCSGSTSGLDACYLASLLLWSNRADQVLVVGAEPDDATARSVSWDGRQGGAGRLTAGAAALVLERPRDAADLRLRLRVGGDGGLPNDARWLLAPPEFASPTTERLDVADLIGDLYGAMGILQVALACALLSSREAQLGQFVAIACGSALDGYRSAVVTAATRADT